MKAFTKKEMKTMKGVKKLFDAPKGKTKAAEKKRVDRFVDESIRFLLG